LQKENLNFESKNANKLFKNKENSFKINFNYTIRNTTADDLLNQKKITRRKSFSYLLNGYQIDKNSFSQTEFNYNKTGIESYKMHSIGQNGDCNP